MSLRATSFVSVVLAVTFFLHSNDVQAKRRKRSRGPIPTHPIVLWAKTINESTDPEQRKVAAFKISKYTRPIFKESIIDTLLTCMNDSDLNIKVLCTQGLSNAQKPPYDHKIRTALLDQYNADGPLRNTVVRTLTARKDGNSSVYSTFLNRLKTTKDTEEQITLLNYFELFGDGSNEWVAVLVELYGKNSDTRLKTAVAKVLSQRSKGQDAAVELLATCSTARDTPLQLTCLSGLEEQGKKDPRAWAAVEKSISSSDPDVLIATLDVINSLPPMANGAISTRLIEILAKVEDDEVKEKAVLAIGVTGNENSEIVNALQRALDDSSAAEHIRIASALILGEQGALFSEGPMAALMDCEKTAGSQNLRTACQLGLRELKNKSKGAEERRMALTADEKPDRSIAETP